MIGLSVVLAIVTQRYVEKPFRHMRFKPRLPPLRTGIAAMCVFIAAGILTREAGGFPQRFNVAASQIIDAANTKVKFARCAEDLGVKGPRNHCAMLGSPEQAANPSVLLMGDSHAEHFSAALDAILSSRGLSGRVLSRGGCPPVLRARTFQYLNERIKCEVFKGADKTA